MLEQNFRGVMGGGGGGGEHSTFLPHMFPKKENNVKFYYCHITE